MTNCPTVHSIKSPLCLVITKVSFVKLGLQYSMQKVIVLSSFPSFQFLLKELALIGKPSNRLFPVNWKST